MKHLTSNHGRHVTISVVVPVYQGMRWIRRCLDSFRLQSMPNESYELILVFNGPDDGALEFASQYVEKSMFGEVHLIKSRATNAAAARNEGLKNASGTHITWVDIDDLISPHYLLALALEVNRDVVPMAQLVNISETGEVDRNTVINNDLFSLQKPIVSPAEFVRSLTFMTGKLIPTRWVREYPLDEGLRSGEDVALYGRILSQFNFEITVRPAMMGAIYYRQLVPHSVSRGHRSRSFLVNERAMVIKSLDCSLKICKTEFKGIIQGYINSQFNFIKNYIANNPDEKVSVLDYLSTLNIGYLPWPRIHDKIEDLAICYNFAPYSDTGANVAAKRIRALGRGTDVISNNMSKVRASAKENCLLSRPYVALHHELNAPVTFANSTAIMNFVEKGLQRFELNRENGRNYKRIYSRSMWPASHFLAAAIKLRVPELEWTAEFSDPVRLTTEGQIRTSPFSFDEVLKLLSVGEMDRLDPSLRGNLDIYAWTEILPYRYADTLVFTNENQLEIMVNAAPEILKGRISSIAQVSHHPTLPKSFYGIGNPQTYSTGNKLRIGYFGEFYKTRGLNEVIHAISSLPKSQQEMIELHVFSSTSIEVVPPDLLPSVVIDHEKLSYYDFLASLNELNCLIVNDAETSDFHDCNPYLPSKYSDYRGSTSSVWSIVESGSVLARSESEYKSLLGDTSGAAEVLQRLLNRFI
ncbi:glycosyltransferase [Glutamicibacter ardleyensis]|uniref:glycosyltransferase n=1 Tax=Glutamicibacter ardleyensis TaxID=225894 RepID=UPI003FD326A7